MKRIRVNLLFSIITLWIVIIIYTVFDNNRIITVEQEIEIDNLPRELDGFTILQITDLHEKEFGQNQEGLIEKINSLSFDIIVFTGDMLKSSESNNYKPFYSLVEGIDRIEKSLYVPGNSDPESYIQNPYKKNNFIIGMEERGVKLLESVYTINRGSSNVIFTYVESSIQNEKKDFSPSDRKDLSSSYVKHKKKILYELNALDGKTESDVLIGLNHYPLVDARLDYIKADSNYIVRNFDLILAGHYHGGQIRIPFLGALFIPEGWYPRSGLFPPQDRVKGLWEYSGIKQYVSTGLGSSDAFPLLKFRFFNTPEINLITLRGRY